MTPIERRQLVVRLAMKLFAKQKAAGVRQAFGAIVGSEKQVRMAMAANLEELSEGWPGLLADPAPTRPRIAFACDEVRLEDADGQRRPALLVHVELEEETGADDVFIPFRVGAENALEFGALQPRAGARTIF